MKITRLAILILGAILFCGSASAQDNIQYEHSGTITDPSGNPIKGSRIFIETAKSDDEGKAIINAKYDRGLFVTAEGMTYVATSFGCDQTIRITLAEKDYYAIPARPKALDLDYSSPIYIVNGIYAPKFAPKNYLDEQIKGVTILKKLNKATKEFLGVNEPDNVKLQGVIEVTLAEGVNLIAQGQAADYTIIVTDPQGAPIKDATIYLQKARSDSEGDFQFQEEPHKRAVVYKSKAYDVANISLDHNKRMNITLGKRKLQPERNLTTATFKNQGVTAFTNWVYTHLDMTLASKLGGEIEDKAVAKATFYVNRKGVVDYVRIVEQNNKVWAEHVKELIYKSPRWTPAKLNDSGETASCKYTIPVILNAPHSY